MIVPEPAHYERERLRRGDVGPVHVVDDHHHRATLLEKAKALQEFGPHRKRVGRFRRAGGEKRTGGQDSRRHRPCQLTDHS